MEHLNYAQIQEYLAKYGPVGPGESVTINWPGCIPMTVVNTTETAVPLDPNKPETLYVSGDHPTIVS